MKKETMQAKLMALLAKANGEEAVEELKEVKQKVEGRKGNIQEISEEEIQKFREAQGILYYLKAPSLFQHKVCTHCGEAFLVSRMFVANCSYTCIRKELEAIGITWTKDRDIEALVHNVYEGNEPIWIRNLPNLQAALQKLIDSSDSESQSALVSTVPQASITTS